MIVHLARRRIGSFLGFLVVFSGAFVGFPSEPNVFWTLSFLVGVAGFFSIYLVDFFYGPKKINIPSIFLLVYLSYILSNALIGLLFGYEFDNWFRGVVGQCVLLLFLPFCHFFKTEDEIRRLSDFLLFTCFAWCGYIFLINYDAILFILSYGGRLSYYDLESVMPFPLVGFIISLLSNRISPFKKISLCFYFLFFSILVGYKIVLGIIVLAIALKVLIFSSNSMRLFLPIVFIVVILGVLSLDVPIVNFYYARLFQIGGEGDQSRLNELFEATGLFMSSPFMGVGYGFTINGLDGDTKSYIHNYLLFLLAGGGLVGATLFGLFIVSVFCIGARCHDRNVAVGVVFALLLSTLTAASYKFIQFNMLIACLCSVACVVRKSK